MSELKEEFDRLKLVTESCEAHVLHAERAVKNDSKTIDLLVEKQNIHGNSINKLQTKIDEFKNSDNIFTGTNDCDINNDCNEAISAAIFDLGLKPKTVYDGD